MLIELNQTTSILCQVTELLYNPLLYKIAIAKKPKSMSETKQFSHYAMKPEARLSKKRDRT